MTPAEYRRAVNLWEAAVTTSENWNDRQLTALGREFIIRHYRAYGGPEPPPIDHQGIKARLDHHQAHAKARTVQPAPVRAARKARTNATASGLSP